MNEDLIHNIRMKVRKLSLLKFYILLLGVWGVVLTMMGYSVVGLMFGIYMFVGLFFYNDMKENLRL